LASRRDTYADPTYLDPSARKPDDIDFDELHLTKPPSLSPYGDGDRRSLEVIDNENCLRVKCLSLMIDEESLCYEWNRHSEQWECKNDSEMAPISSDIMNVTLAESGKPGRKVGGDVVVWVNMGCGQEPVRDYARSVVWPVWYSSYSSC
jgi:hypothetical protein